MKNQVQLITYADRLSGRSLRELHAVLTGPLKGVFGGVHILPFFYPIDGADAGFDPIDHTLVDPKLGTWNDIRAVSRDVDLMVDVIVNHMSVESPQFQDFSRHGDASRYRGLFLTQEKVFPKGATASDLSAIYRPRPGTPFTAVALQNGDQRVLWTTFTPQQVDIDVRDPQGRAYFDSILRRFSDNGIRMVRLDAIGYAIKRAGTSCFMVPETFDFIDEFATRVRDLGMEVLVEIHSYYRQQIEIAARVDWVYDFALPPLLLHAFAFKTAKSLKEWIVIRPRNALTVLDTHDGIGVIDVGPDTTDRVERPGLVPPAELDRLVEIIHERTNGESRQATGAAASNLDLYQVNCTFYDAINRSDREYLLARAIQFFLPGVPQVYYVGLLAGSNDTQLLARTHVGRDINRHYYSAVEVDEALRRPVVRSLLELIRMRNSHPAFNGEFSLRASDDDSIQMGWTQGKEHADLAVNFRQATYQLTFTHERALRHFRLPEPIGVVPAPGVA